MKRFLFTLTVGLFILTISSCDGCHNNIKREVVNGKEVEMCYCDGQAVGGCATGIQKCDCENLTVQCK